LISLLLNAILKKSKHFMRSDFQKYVEFSGILPEEAPYAHSVLMNNFMHFEKFRFDKQMAYLKNLCFFALVAIFIVIFNGVIFGTMQLLGITFAGVTFLIIILLDIFICRESDRKVLYCINEGKKLEELYPDAIKTNIFKRMDAIKIYGYRSALQMRLVSIGIIFCATATSGFFLALKYHLWLAIATGPFAALVFTAITFWIVHITKTDFLLNDKNMS
jgi:hypothetical protein